MAPPEGQSEQPQGSQIPKYATLQDDADAPGYEAATQANATAPSASAVGASVDGYAPVQQQRHPARTAAMATALVAVIGGGAFGVYQLMKDDTASPAAAQPSVSSAPSVKLCPATVKVKGSKMPKASQIQVRVLNGTSRAGWGGANADKLKDRGFNIQFVGNDDSGEAVTGKGEIRYGDASAKAAARLSTYMPGAKLIPLPRQADAVDVVLGPEFNSFRSYNEAMQVAEESAVTVPLMPKPCK